MLGSQWTGFIPLPSRILANECCRARLPSLRRMLDFWCRRTSEQVLSLYLQTSVIVPAFHPCDTGSIPSAGKLVNRFYLFPFKDPSERVLSCSPSILATQAQYSVLVSQWTGFISRSSKILPNRATAVAIKLDKWHALQVCSLAPGIILVKLVTTSISIFEGLEPCCVVSHELLT